VLVRDFSVLEFHDPRAEVQLSSPWRVSGKQIVQLRIVREAHNEFVHDLVFADSAGDGRNLRISGNLAYEVLIDGSGTIVFMVALTS
jgi:hypothetical protein